MTRLAALALAVAAVAACGRSPVPAPPAAAVAALEHEANALAHRGQYAAAVSKYREALELAPDSVAMRFALGSALSHLGDREGAVLQFRWVARGEAARAEVQAARRWLRQAGFPVESPMDVAAARREGTGAEPAGDLGAVKGLTTWPHIAPDSFNLQLQILLEGDDSATRGRRIAGRARLGGPFEIRDVPAGAWRLMAQVGAVRLWDERVLVAPGKETTVELGPASSPVSPDHFPVPAHR